MRKICQIMIILLAAISCSKEEPVNTAEGVQANVTLSLAVSGEITITTGGSEIGSKAINDPENPATAADLIKNLWIIQYNGTADNSTLLGEPSYIEDFQQFNGNVKLVATTQPSTIYLIANTFENKESFSIPQGSTIADLKGKSRVVESQESILGKEGISDTRHVMFFGKIIADKISEGTNLASSLSRNIAKTSIKITNNTEGKGDVTINSVQICNIPGISHYVPEYPADGTFPAGKDFASTSFAAMEWPSGSKTMEFTSYIPVNARGTISNASELSKNRYAPDKATYMIVSGSYADNGENVPVTYTFYLGGNMTDDFNIKSNNSYTYDIVLESKGDNKTDSRIDDWRMVDYTSSMYRQANSYILNPIPGGTAKRVFRIPIKQIITFWGRDGFAEYEDDEYMSLRTNGGKWKAWILKSDFNIDGSNFILSKSQGTKDQDPYFEVKVAPGVKGNVVIAAGPDDNSGSISWSWHLWITDYNPYDANIWDNSTEGQYIYPVENGAVHRYEGIYWTNHKNVYSMDRNLGAASADTYPSDNAGLLYYQFGRKDPFFFKSSNVGNTVTSDIADNPANGNNGVIYSIKNPDKFITAASMNETSAYYAWTRGNRYNPSEYDETIIWHDPTTGRNGSNEGEKSIFDPCPPGYRLPDKTVWSDFRLHSDNKPTTNSFENGRFGDDPIDSKEYKNGFKHYNEVKGMQYWPFQGENILIPEKPIYFPASGYFDPSGRMYHHGNMSNAIDIICGSNAEKWSFLWSENTYDENQGAGYTSQPDHLAPENTVTRTRAFPVRCITDK